MNNFISVFRAIKENCKEAGVSSEICFAELEKLVKDNKVFLSLYLHLEVLQSLGLIRLYLYKKEIILTEKGKYTDYYSVSGWRVSLLLFLHFLRQVLFFVLFWPMLLVMQKPNTEHEKNSAG